MLIFRVVSHKKNDEYQLQHFGYTLRIVLNVQASGFQSRRGSKVRSKETDRRLDWQWVGYSTHGQANYKF